MRTVALLLLGMAITGCSNDSTPAAKPSADQPPPLNRWTVIPAGQITEGGTTEFNAWRLDAQTGELDFCIYDPGGAPLPKGAIQQPALNCSASDTPS